MLDRTVASAFKVFQSDILSECLSSEVQFDSDQGVEGSVPCVHCCTKALVCGLERQSAPEDQQKETSNMERNAAEDVRVGGEECGAAAGKNVDRVAVLRSLLAEILDDIVRLLSQGPPDDRWCGPRPDTLAFLKYTKQTLKLQR